LAETRYILIPNSIQFNAAFWPGEFYTLVWGFYRINLQCLLPALSNWLACQAAKSHSRI